MFTVYTVYKLWRIIVNIQINHITITPKYQARRSASACRYALLKSVSPYWVPNQVSKSSASFWEAKTAPSGVVHSKGAVARPEAAILRPRHIEKPLLRPCQGHGKAMATPSGIRDGALGAAREGVRGRHSDRAALCQVVAHPPLKKTINYIFHLAVDLWRRRELHWVWL